MANLETLELTISANAESASQGVNNLIGSLTRLSKVVGKSVGGLKLLVSELKKLEEYSGVKLPDFAKAMGAVAKNAKKITKEPIDIPTNKLDALKMKLEATSEAMEKAAEKGNKLTVANKKLQEIGLQQQIEKTTPKPSVNAPETKLDALRIKLQNLNEEMERAARNGDKLTAASKKIQISSVQKQIKAELEAAKKGRRELTKEEIANMGNRNAINKASADAKPYEVWKKEYDERMKQLQEERQERLKLADQQRKIWQERVAEEHRQKALAQETKDAAENSSVMSKVLERAKGTVQSIANGFHRISRILSTMLIRTAIRGLLKGFTNAWNSMYEFSKSVNGDFAKSIDTIKGLTLGAAQNIISAFAPALTALVPIVNTVAAAINYLANAIKWLLSLLGTGSELFGATTEEINKFSGAASGGSSAAKEMLASFDELNVISSKGGGGGGGGGTSALMPSDIIESQMAEIGIIASKASLALGLILACTGHIGLGAALIAVGAAGIAKSVTENWDTLPSTIKDKIATISAVTEALMVATGLILALSGANIPLGIGLIAAGVVGLATTASLSWWLDGEIKSRIAGIMEAVGVGLMAIGCILAFTGHPALGIGLMIGGAAVFGGGVALNWGFDTHIEGIVNHLDWVVGGLLLALGATMAFTGANIPLGIALLALGAVKIARASGLSDRLSQDVQGIMMALENAIGGLFLAMGALLAISGVNVPLGLALIGIGALSIVQAARMSWGLSEDIVSEVSYIESAVGGLALAVGAVLAFTGAKPVLGVALMALGAASLAAGLTMNWRFGDDVLSVSEKLEAALSGAELALGAIVLFTGASIPLGLGLIVAGATGLVASLGRKFGFDEEIVAIAQKIEAGVGIAFLALGAILTFTGVNIPLGLGLLATGGVSLAAAIVPNWNSLVSKLDSVVQNVISVLQPLIQTLEYVLELANGVAGLGGILPTNKTANAIVDAATNKGTNTNLQDSSIYNFYKNGFNKLLGKASGAYGIDRGDVFIANEAGAELVGSINGKSSVANQEQIIEGIARGVESANADQNTLLREQNTLLRQILQKDNSVRLSASAQLGRVTRQSLDMYGSMVGG